MNALILFTQYLIVPETLAAIAGFITWHKWKDSYLKWFPVYLTIIVLFEISYHLSTYKYALLMYEIIIPIEILFINWFFYKTFNRKNKKLIATGIFCYIIALLLEKTSLNNNTYYFQSLAYTIANLFVLIYLILFFIELVNSEKILAFKKLTVFWIVCGILVFYLGTFPFYGLYNELAKNINIFIPIAWVATSFNYCMYILFTIGFIWGKPH